MRIVSYSSRLPVLFIAICLIFVALCASTVHAITRGYFTEDAKLLPGMAAALGGDEAGGDSRVERASIASKDRIVGIATTIEDSLVTVASGSSQVYIETQGDIDAFVTTINGSVQQGDLLTISPLKGILMRAEGTTTPVVGVALTTFDKATAETYTLGNGEATEIAKIRINLDRKGSNAAAVAASESSLERLGRSLTGKDVGEVRVIVALVIFVLVLLVEGAILYGAISSAITSLGRNPLAKLVIRRELGRIIIVVFLVLLIGLGSIYAILWI